MDLHHLPVDGDVLVEISQGVEGVGGDHIEVVPAGHVLDGAVPHAVGADGDPLTEQLLDLLGVKLPGVGVQRDDRHILFHGVLPSFLAIYFNQFNRFNSILRDFPPHVKPIPAFFRGFWALEAKKCSWHAGCTIK